MTKGMRNLEVRASKSATGQSSVFGLRRTRSRVKKEERSRSADGSRFRRMKKNGECNAHIPHLLANSKVERGGLTNRYTYNYSENK